MNKSELVAAVAARTEQSQKDVDETIVALFEVVSALATVGLSIDWEQSYTTIGPTATQLSTNDFQRIQFDSYSGNSGYEGVTYDPILETFYVVKEKSPKRIRSFVRPSTSADTTVDADTPFNAEGLPASDLSAVTLDSRTGRLLILSDESHRLMDVGLDGVVHGQLAMADTTQHEGVAMDSSFNIFVTSEPRSYRVYTQ